MPPKRPATALSTPTDAGSTGTPHSVVSDDDVNVQVFMRPRPLNELEQTRAGDKLCISLADNSVEFVKTGTTPDEGPRFTFDHIFPPVCSQSDVFNQLGPKAIRDVLNGYNSTIFAYGQTSSGKTFTMLGPTMDMNGGEFAGFIPRSATALFEGLAEVCRSNPSIEVTVKVTYVEVYMETIRDLLEPTSINLELREDKERGVFIDKARSVFVTSPQELLEVIATGAQNRELAATGMNADSSRSHSVLILTVKQKNVDDESTKQSKLVLVDLAGSESVGKTGAVGQQLEEAKMINKSLLALNMVINSLSQRKSFIPYRDSKLTRMLQESLGGNARTTLVICVSMSAFNTAETFSTIRFGASAKNIKNKARVNVTKSLTEVMDALEQSKKHITRQNTVIADLESKIERYRAILQQHGIPDTVMGESTTTVKPIPVQPPTEPTGRQGNLGSQPPGSGSGQGGTPQPQTPNTPNTRIPVRTGGSSSRPGSSSLRTSVIGTRDTRTGPRPGSAQKNATDLLPVSFATVSLAPKTNTPTPLDVTTTANNTIQVSLDDEFESITSSLGVGVTSNTNITPTPPIVDIPTVPEPKPTTVASHSAEYTMRILELEDEVTDLRKKLEDRDSELKSKADELMCLSASLLEKEKLIRSGGLGSGGGVPMAEDEAHKLAAQSMMNRELETMKEMSCKHCGTRPFEQAKTVSDLFILHEQSCFSANENKMLVKSLRDRVASLNSEVESLKSYVEAISMEIMGDNADEFEEGKRQDRLAADYNKLQSQLAEREVELHRLQKIMKSSDPRLDSQTARRIAMLQEDVSLKEAEIRNCRDVVYRKDLLIADLEEQCKRKEDATVVRELNHQLRQMVLVHRQLLRKFAVIDVESNAQVQLLQSRESQIAKLNKEIMRLNEQLREQSEWSALQMQQLHLENMRRQQAVVAASNSHVTGGAGGGRTPQKQGFVLGVRSIGASSFSAV